MARASRGGGWTTWLAAFVTLAALFGASAFIYPQEYHGILGLCRKQSQVKLSTERFASTKNVQEEVVDVCVVGAGIGGAAAAGELHRRGLNVLLLEQAGNTRKEGSAIGLWTQAWRALDYLEVGSSLRGKYNEGTKLQLLTDEGNRIGGFPINECDFAPHEFRYVMRSDLVDGIKTGGSNDKIIELEDGRKISAKVIVGADGINSSVRSIIKPSDSRPNFAGYKAFRGITKSKSSAIFDQIKDDTIYQVWGRGIRMGVSRMSPGTIYWFITYNAGEALTDQERDPIMRKELAKSLVAGWAWGGGVGEALVEATAPADMVVGAMRDRLPELGPWGEGAITLIGDAAHPMTPNLAQGGAAALEDAVELASALGALGGPGLADPARAAAALRGFESKRVKRLAKLNLKSLAFGAALQLPFPPVTFVRNNIAVPGLLKVGFLPKNFLDHTDWYPPEK